MTAGKKIMDLEAGKSDDPKAKDSKEGNNKRRNGQETATTVPATFPVVGIGASAGGLAAFEAFFSGMPADVDPAMAFVLVQHLAPDHKSILSDLVQKYTRMKVYEVEDGMPVQPNCTYIIPPGRDMALLNGTLQLLEPSAPHGQRLPINFFFRSLAQDQHERAICIILSGTGSDGTLGLRAIKEEGGMIMVQTPESTEYEGMPRSAISTGLVDYLLPPAKMPEQLIAYAAYSSKKQFKPEISPEPKIENALKKIFVLLRAHTGNDFSNYKASTINRRIERRMALHQIDMLDDYIHFLQNSPEEVEALFRDLLIGVTNFFRDPEAFNVLEKQTIPKLFENKPEGSTVRIWIPGCSTGEEAYSIAIIVNECLETLTNRVKVQLFATDIDSNAIASARNGIYPLNITADISPERMLRFFTAEHENKTYRINKEIRDMLIFSVQNIIKDPPFSKLDLISCRNLMIYLDADLQKRLIPLFYYALNPKGILFLGSSETVGEFHSMFSILDRKCKIYQRKEEIQGAQKVTISQILPQKVEKIEALHKAITKTTDTEKDILCEITEQAIIKHMALVAALVNAQGVILYLHGQTGKYLELTTGIVDRINILTIAREGLRWELTTALHNAHIRKETITYSDLHIKNNEQYITMNLTVIPIEASYEKSQNFPLYLVIFEEGRNVDTKQSEIQPPSQTISKGAKGSVKINKLKAELRAKDEYLQAANEELETANEELKSANEEMQSVNEELQSTNEELETSKEELQSVNEELMTVNSELQSKFTDLTLVNNDMNNLLAGTGIATIFVDHSLHIMRFTPAATRIINLIPSDIGRPVGHVVTNLAGYDTLTKDIQTVLDTLVSTEIEVKTKDDRWYALRINPYRTLENVIEGAVIFFIDINEIVIARESMHKYKEQLQLAVIVRDSRDAVTMQNIEGRILAWNPAAKKMYGWSESEALKMNGYDRIPQKQKVKEIEVMRQLALSIVIKPYRTQRITKDGSIVEIWMTVSALLDESGQMYGIATTERIKT